MILAINLSKSETELDPYLKLQLLSKVATENNPDEILGIK
jgi:hypothetical protein